jgi:hypothetical protein
MGMFDNLFEPDYSEKSVEGIDYTVSYEGYRIMTEYYLVKRGYCCSNGCKNCPYSPKAIKGNRILRPELETKYNKQ